MSGRTVERPEDLREILSIPFSDEQLAVIAAPLEPGVVIAAAGSGKTTVMAARVVWLVGTGQVRADQVLGLTFTRKAAAELSNRVTTALSGSGIIDAAALENSEAQTITTYDSFAGQLVSEHAPRIGIDPAEHRLTDATRYRLAAQVVAANEFPLVALGEWNDRRLIGALLGLDTMMTQHMVTGQRIEEFTADYVGGLDEAPLWRGAPYRAVVDAERVAAERLELLGLVESYRRAKDRLGWVEFADLMAQAATIAERAPEVSTMLREQYRVLLLDEYQDTSSAQATLLTTLFSGPTVAEGRGHPVTAVGDPYQSIYGWRGAAASNIAEFPTSFPKADGTAANAYSLRVNRRSGPEILDGANVVAQGLQSDPAMPHLPGVDFTLHAAPGQEPATVTTRHFTSSDEELDWIADDIAARGALEGYAGIAVLVRRNATIEPLFRRLSARDVPTEIVGLAGLFRLAVISEIVATLRLLDDDTDNPALVQLLSSRRWQIGPPDLAALGEAVNRLNAVRSDPSRDQGGATPAADPPASLRAELARQQEQAGRPMACLMDVLDLPCPGLSQLGSSRLGRFVAEFRELRRHVSEPLPGLVRRIVAAMNLGVELLADPGTYSQHMGAQVARFLEVVGDFTDLDGTARLSGFLSYVESVLDEEDGMEQALPTADDSVSLLSVHRAKGLEWDTVYLPTLVEGTFPATVRGDNWTTLARLLPSPLRGDAGSIPQLGETTKAGLQAFGTDLRSAGQFAEDRLAYVAITRARRHLVATTHVWEPQRKTASHTSEYFRVLAQISGGDLPEQPAPDADNPVAAVPATAVWPRPADPDREELVETAAGTVQGLIRRLGPGAGGDPGIGELPAQLAGELSLDEQQAYQEWQAEAQLLVRAAREQARDAHRVVPVESLSASALILSQAEPEQFAANLVRPMPRRASGGAGVGTRFHDWLEQRFRAGSGLLVGDDESSDELPARMDASSQRRLEILQRRFEEGPYADLTPYRVEAPFILVLGSRQVRGRIDAVYRLPGSGPHRFQVVDWKTFDGPADPLQLALYRLAWADVSGVEPDEVDAVFCHVMSGRVERPTGLPGRDELTRLVEHLPGLNDRMPGAPDGPGRRAADSGGIPRHRSG
ncbi:UvrD-helicase domain-containing protein [Propionibacterium freudenreichii]|uniref:UvrD-helicase domain-containing protein n=1 Tax=Propionibacterium freudenreichii TaxID=1744 RepID=UPI0038537260